MRQKLWQQIWFHLDYWHRVRRQGFWWTWFSMALFSFMWAPAYYILHTQPQLTCDFVNEFWPRKLTAAIVLPFFIWWLGEKLYKRRIAKGYVPSSLNEEGSHGLGLRNDTHPN